MNTQFPRALLLGLPFCGLSFPAQAQTSPAAPQAPTEAPDPNEIVARVGRIEITQQDLTGEFERLIPQNFFHGSVPDEKKQGLRIQARDSLVDKALIYQDAQDRPIQVSEESLRERFRDTLSKSGPRFAKVSDEQFETLLEQYRPDVLRRIMIERNEERFDKSLEPISEEALKTHFEEVKDQLFTRASASFLMIQIDVDPSVRNDMLPIAHLKASELLAKLKAGQSFEDLARKYSNASSAAKGGALGFVTKSGFPVAELREPAFELKDGETSGAIESIYGVHLVRRLSTQPRKPLGFEQARPQLRASLEHVQRSKQRKAWFEDMRRRYPVQLLVVLEEAP